MSNNNFYEFCLYVFEHADYYSAFKSIKTKYIKFIKIIRHEIPIDKNTNIYPLSDIYQSVLKHLSFKKSYLLWCDDFFTN